MRLLHDFSEGMARDCVDGEWGFTRCDGVLAIPYQYEDAEDFSSGMAPVKKNGKWGYIDPAGNVIIPLQFGAALRFRGDTAVVSVRENRTREDGKWGMIDRAGISVVPPDYDSLGPIEEDLTILGIKHEQTEDAEQIYGWDFFDNTGKKIASHKYSKISDFCDGLARVKRDGKYGYIDKSAREIAPLIYDYAFDYYINPFAYYPIYINYYDEYIDIIQDLWLMSDDDDTDCFAEDGSSEISEYIKYFVEDGSNENLAERVLRVKLQGKWGYICKNGHTIVEPQFDYMSNYFEGLSRVKQDGRWGFIDKAGAIAIPLQFDYVHNFKEGFARVRIDDKWGYIDKAGKLIIPLLFDDARDFTCGEADVCFNGDWGRINNMGETVADFTHKQTLTHQNREDDDEDEDDDSDEDDDIVRMQNSNTICFDENYLCEGMSVVKLNRKYGYIDETGVLAIPIQYDSAQRFIRGGACVNIDGKWGCIDKSGNEIVPFLYSHLEAYLDHDLLKAKYEDRWGYIDRTGKEVIPFVFNKNKTRWGDDILIQKLGEKVLCNKVLVVLNEKWTQLQNKSIYSPVEHLLSYLDRRVDANIQVLDKSSNFFAILIFTNYYFGRSAKDYVKAYLVEEYDVPIDDIDNIVAIKYGEIGIAEAEKLIQKYILDGKAKSEYDLSAYRAYYGLADYYQGKGMHSISVNYYEKCVESLASLKQNGSLDDESQYAKTFIRAGAAHGDNGSLLKAAKYCLMGIDAIKASDESSTQYIYGVIELVKIFKNLEKTQMVTKIHDEYPLLDVALEDLDFSVRAFITLKRSGIDTVADILAHTKESLSKVRNLGRKSLAEVIDKITALGLSLKSDV